MTESARTRRRPHSILIRTIAVLGAAALATVGTPAVAGAAPNPTATAGAPTSSHSSVSKPPSPAVTRSHKKRLATVAAATAPGEPAEPGVVSAEATASTTAKATGEPVVVDALTDETSQTVANPDGSLTLTQHATPVRVRRGSAWVTLDTNLNRRTDGSIVPAATESNVAFSGGGTGPLVTMTSGADELSISWSGTLPVPTIAKDTATYANVLPDVDLAMTAQASGFGEVVIVKSAAAAANPALTSLHFGISTKGLTLAKASDGTETAIDASGAAVFHTGTSIMWDSTDITAPSASRRLAAPTSEAVTAPVAQPAPAGTDSSDVHRPGAAAHVAPLAVAVQGADLTVTPDPTLLTGSERVFPLYIDPAWSGNPSVVSWAAINSAGGKSTSGTDAQLGYDDWAGCDSWCGSVSRSYFEMNDSGFQGANVTAAYFYAYFHWAADSSAEPTQIWLDPDFPSNLSWSNKPGASSPSTYVTAVSSCAGHGTSGCAAGTVQFNVTSAAKIAAGGGRRDLEVDAADEGNDMQWKRIDPTKTSWSVTYYRAPYLNSTLTTTPKVTGPGGTFVNSQNVTTLATGGDTDGEDVRSNYEIWDWVNNAATKSVATGLYSAYTASGGSYTYRGLHDGTYAWRARTNSKNGNMSSGWSAWQAFTVDSSAPPTPSVESVEFPAGQFGAAYTETGKFTITTYGQDNVAGFLFSLDGDLGSTTWSQSNPPPTWNGTKITRGSQYWVPISNGTAQVSFTPLTVGPHRLFVKAVDDAGNVSATEATYLFYAGLTSPIYAYGDKLVNGCPITNTCSGNTGAIPAAVATVSAGASVTSQSNIGDVRFADGTQALLSDGSGKVAAGDSATFSFNLPSAGYWDIGANLTNAFDYGKYTLVLDKGLATQDVLAMDYDAYASPTTTTYKDYGAVTNASGAPVQLAAGVHAVTLVITGKNSSSTGYQAGIDVLRISPMSSTCTIVDLSACAGNTAISDDANHLAADADGSGASFSAAQLKTAGWAPGASLTVNGAPVTLPNYAAGKADNVLSAGQTVTVPQTYPNNGNAIEFLAFSTDAPVTGASGTITYAQNCNSSTTQSFTIDNVPAWVDGNATQHLIGFPGRNLASGQDAHSPQIFAVSVPLACPGQAVTSVNLPVVTNKTLPSVPALHILAMGIRASSYTDATHAQNWTATYAAAQDKHLGSLNAQTIRLPVHISIGGTNLRVHLSNTLGSVPVSIDHVTIAAQNSGAIPVGTPTDVLFGTTRTITIPAGGETVSDVLTFKTTDQQDLLVTIHLSAADADVVGHNFAQATGWTAAAGTDYASDITGAPFTTAITTVDWLAGIDVTSADTTLGSLILYGDQTINSDTGSADGQHHLSDLLTSKLAVANNGKVPYGVVSEGTNSKTQSNGLLPPLSSSSTAIVPPSALNPVDSNILNNANVRTVLISTGMSDIVMGSDATTIENKLAAVSEQVRHFYTDDSTNYKVNLNNTAGLVTVYIARIAPNANGLTNSQEAVREAVNAWILTKSESTYADGHADGVIDFAAAVSNTGTDAGTTLAAADVSNNNPNDSYYNALAQQFITNTATPPAPTNSVSIQPMVMR